MESTVGGRLCWTVSSSVPPESPSSDSTEFYGEDLDYVNLGIASALIYYHAIKIHLNHLILDIAARFSLASRAHVTGQAADQSDDDLCLLLVIKKTFTQTLSHAKLICASIRYCFDQDKGILGKMIGMFPFDAAWLAYLRAQSDTEFDFEREIAYCEATVERYETSGFTPIRDRRRRRTDVRKWNEV